LIFIITDGRRIALIRLFVEIMRIHAEGAINLSQLAIASVLDIEQVKEKYLNILREKGRTWQLDGAAMTPHQDITLAAEAIAKLDESNFLAKSYIRWARGDG
jgi:hypothetical protein